MQKCPKFKNGRWLKCADCRYLKKCELMHPKTHTPKWEEDLEAQGELMAWSEPMQKALRKRSETYINTERDMLTAEKLGLTRMEKRELIHYVLNVNLSCWHYNHDDVVKGLCHLILRREGREWRESKLMQMVEAKLHKAYPQLWS